MIAETSDFHRDKRQAFRTKAYPKQIWKDGVPFSYHKSMNKLKKTSVMSAMNFFQRHTCIRFRPRKKEKQYLYYIGHDQGCWSSVGRDASQGQQWLSIGDGCEPFGISSHEVAHALGLFHEQSRYDRDKHVQVLANRVPNGLYYNFGKVGPSQLKTYGVPYEIGSVMHYGPTEFSKQPNVPSVIANDPNFQYTMGSLTGPTFLDVRLLNLHYDCLSRCTLRAKCFNGGYNDPNHCGYCKCPEGFSGRDCSRRQKPTVPGCGGLIRVTRATRKLRIHIKPNKNAKYLRTCAYHLVAPKGRKIEMRLRQLGGTLCESGCWRQAIELKPQRDKRGTGYRFCCPGYANRKLISADHFVPLFLFTRTGDTKAVVTFKIHRKQGREGSSGDDELGEELDSADLSDYLQNEEIEEEPSGHDEATVIEDPEEGGQKSETTEAPAFVTATKQQGPDFEAELLNGSETGGLDKEDDDEKPEILTEFPAGEVDPLSYIHPADLPSDEDLEATIANEEPIDTSAFSAGTNPAQNSVPFSEASKELKS
ncbi:unnamed protein product, partial [Mesorhabditis spiculigera]